MTVDLSKLISLVESEQYTSTVYLKPFLRIKGAIGVEELLDIESIYGKDALYWLAGKTLLSQSNLIAKHGGRLSSVPRDKDGCAPDYFELVGNLYEQLENLKIELSIEE